MDQPTVDVCAADGCSNAAKKPNPVNGQASRYCSRSCQMRAWQRANRDLTRAYGREHYARNVEAGRERARRERAKAPEIHRARVESWRQRNTEATTAYNRRYDELNRERRIARQANRRAMIRDSSVRKLDPTDVSARMAYYGHRCWMCGDPYAHIDHVKPLSKGGPHILANLRPACGPCNQFKYSKWLGPHRLDALRRN